MIVIFQSGFVHGYQYLLLFSPGQVTFMAHPDPEPGGKALNIGWKEVFPLTGTPILNMARMIARFAVWLPDPLTVATLILKSLIIL